ncbi:uncharacterized protein [Ptychodera flava]|uniref:uncharacterized protein n=1 Tax=Ptychodera flava TaxID=63121 RepID=UPI003969FC4A
MNMSLSQIIERFGEFPAIISNLDKIPFSSPEESQAMAEEILEDMHEGITAFLAVKAMNKTSVIGEELPIKTILQSTNRLSSFVLRNTKPGSGQVVLDTPYINLNLESDSAEKVTNATIALGDGDGFVIPPAKKIFSNQSLDDEAINRIATRFNRRSMQMKIENNTYIISADNVLSLSFTDRNGREIEAKETNEDICISFASDPPPQETFALVTGVYHVINDVTFFGMNIPIKRLFYATIIWFENSDILYGNTSAYVFKEEVDYSEEYRGYQFSVSPESNITTTVCLCNHLTTFAEDKYAVGLQ